ncbi:class I SAM-dependent methyltransferase [Aureimonas mangrovi]|uniref:class I SAM-dependent methyltransferase n=1 Tax=Aureimonas mangrovi TaxID=2758041 RepID=UPI00163D6BDB|nr:class I SAM-dependent methyltransferase [Aureimonas mangrovi]
MNFATRAAFMKPRRIVEPGPWIGLVPFAFWLVEAARPRTIVELGTHTGNSFCAFLQAAEAEGLDTKVFAVDHWMGDEHSGHYGDDVYTELQAYVDAVYPGRATMIRSSFDDALDGFENGSIDILHIDGMHTYDAVRKDFDSWLPKVAPNGLVLLHDTAVRARDFGVWKLLEEVSADHRTAQLHNSHGLGIVALGEQPAPISALLDGSRDQAGLSSDEVFAPLGDAVMDAFHLTKFLAYSDPGAPAASLKRSLMEHESPQSVLADIFRQEAHLRSTIRSQYVETGRVRDLLIPQILATPFFVPAHYASQRGSEGISAWSLCDDYLVEGEREGHSPSPLFDPAYYRSSNADVAASDFGMLEHFILHGLREGRPPLPPQGSVFDEETGQWIERVAEPEEDGQVAIGRERI